jgi:hypothetical protein
MKLKTLRQIFKGGFDSRFSERFGTVVMIAAWRSEVDQILQRLPEIHYGQKGKWLTIEMG